MKPFSGQRRSQRIEQAKRPSVVFTQDSRPPNGVDAMWSSRTGAGFSAVFPTKTTAADFPIPEGKTGILKGVQWTDNPPIFCSGEGDVGLIVYLNAASTMNFRRAINPGGPTFTNVGFECGYSQGLWLPTFLRVSEGDILTLEVITFTVVFTRPSFMIHLSLSDISGDPIEGQFTNPVRK